MRDFLRYERNDGTPGALQHLVTASVFVVAVGIEVAFAPMQAAAAWIDRSIGPPKAVWLVSGPIAIALIHAGYWNKHQLLFRFRWYRRAFRRGATARHLASWAGCAALVLLTIGAMVATLMGAS